MQKQIEEINALTIYCSLSSQSKGFRVLKDTHMLKKKTTTNHITQNNKGGSYIFECSQFRGVGQLTPPFTVTPLPLSKLVLVQQ